MKIFVTLTLTFATTLASADCGEIAKTYSSKLSIPYENFTDLGLRKCIDLQQVSPANLHGFVAAAFYDNALAMRKKAMDKLEAHRCENDHSCEALYQLIDGHLKATVLTQVDLIAKRAERLRDRIKKSLPVRPEALVVYPARHLSVTIAKAPDEVSAFLGRPENFPRWASGLSTKLTRSGDHWVAESPMGKVHVSFSAPNSWGVADHDVTLADGRQFHNPLRVLKNGTGSEVVFTLYRMPGTTDDAFEKDAQTVLRDLEKLRTLF